MTAKIHELLTGPNKWHKGSIGPMDGECHCLYGWLQKVYYFPFRGGAGFAATDKMAEVCGKVDAVIGKNFGIAKWNDAPERTFEEVRELCVKLDL